MALDLDLWAQLNLFGHVSYSEYLEMTPEEAKACFLALKKVIDRERNTGEGNKAWEQHVAKYENPGLFSR